MHSQFNRPIINLLTLCNRLAELDEHISCAKLYQPAKEAQGKLLVAEATAVTFIGPANKMLKSVYLASSNKHEISLAARWRALHASV